MPQLNPIASPNHHISVTRLSHNGNMAPCLVDKSDLKEIEMQDLIISWEQLSTEQRDELIAAAKEIVQITSSEDRGGLDASRESFYTKVFSALSMNTGGQNPVDFANSIDHTINHNIQEGQKYLGSVFCGVRDIALATAREEVSKESGSHAARVQASRNCNGLAQGR